MENEFKPTCILIGIAGILLPLVLIPIVAVTGSSEVIEELAKLAVIYLIIFRLPATESKIFGSILFAVAYGISETFFIASSMSSEAIPLVLSARFVFTIPMHIVTVLVVSTFGAWRRYLLPLGFLIAVIIHTAFNYYAPGIV